jgi:hypothetical protein
MKTLTLLSLAAGAALLPTVALAQPAPRAGGGAGVTWGGGGAVGGGGQFRGGQFRGGFGGGVRMPRFRPGHGFPRRLTRGAFIHPFWFGPQFFIQNWQGYGFVDPGPDRRWVRYYDDAYLIDQGGRVVDMREGLDWDQYGERWEVEDGIPSYYGRNQYQPDDEDYAYVDRRRGDAYAGRGDDDDGHDRRGHPHGGMGYGGPMPVAPVGHGMGCGAPATACGAPGMVYGAPGMVYGGGGTTTAVYGGGYGYGMYAYPIIIETTTVTGGATYSEEIIEEVIQTRRARRRARGCNCRPRPPAGERG